MGALALSLTISVPVAAQVGSEPVPYLDDEGNQLGTILVRDFVDPYAEFDPASPPAEGLRYALLTATFEAAEDAAFPTDPYQVQLQDSNGYLHHPQSVRRSADSVMPDLQSQVLAPLDRVSGHVPYVLPEDAEIVRIVYRGDGRRLMPIADIGEAGSVAVGEPMVITDDAGTSYGSVTVREAMDPFMEFDPNGPPAEGQRYVVLDMAFEAAEDQAIGASPSSVGLVATDGMVYWPAWVPRPDPFLLQYLESQPLSPGDRISGVVTFAIPQDVEIDFVVYNLEGNRFLSVADL
jgi:hypothetical protein